MTTCELLEVWTDADFQWRLRDLLETLPAIQRIRARSRACALLDRLPPWKSGTWYFSLVAGHLVVRAVRPAAVVERSVMARDPACGPSGPKGQVK